MRRRKSQPLRQSYAEAAQQIRRRERSNYPDRVLCVKDPENGTSGVEQFFGLVCQSANAVFEDTPIDDIVKGFLLA